MIRLARTGTFNSVNIQIGIHAIVLLLSGARKGMPVGHRLREYLGCKFNLRFTYAWMTYLP
jgi:hypothetical protein